MLNLVAVRRSLIAEKFTGVGVETGLDARQGLENEA
jgi:hypothetical protein